MVIFLERDPSVPEAMQTFGIDSLHLTPDELKAKYRSLSLQHHPDRGGSVEAMQDVNAAYDVLKANLGRSASDYNRGSSNTYRPRPSRPRPSNPRPSNSHSSSSHSTNQSDFSFFADLLDRYSSYIEANRDGIRLYPFTRNKPVYITIDRKTSSSGNYYTFDKIFCLNRYRSRTVQEVDSVDLPNIRVPEKASSIQKLISCISEISEVANRQYHLLVHPERDHATITKIIRASIKKYFE